MDENKKKLTAQSRNKSQNDPSSAQLLIMGYQIQARTISEQKHFLLSIIRPAIAVSLVHANWLK